jgi:hypothetical protein
MLPVSPGKYRSRCCCSFDSTTCTRADDHHGLAVRIEAGSRYVGLVIPGWAFSDWRRRITTTPRGLDWRRWRARISWRVRDVPWSKAVSKPKAVEDAPDDAHDPAEHEENYGHEDADDEKDGDRDRNEDCNKPAAPVIAAKAPIDARVRRSTPTREG